jgi:hypothetical protein
VESNVEVQASDEHESAAEIDIDADDNGNSTMSYELVSLLVELEQMD